jgi:hypothetical protein
MANTTGRPVGPLQYRLDANGVEVGIVDAQGNEFVLVGGSTLPNVVIPTAVAYGASVDGQTLSTSTFQASLDAAKSSRVEKPGGSLFGYGYGGKALIPCGVLLTGPVECSRSVTIEGSGALASTTLLSDYSALNGVAGEDALISMASDGTAEGGITQQQKFANFAIDGQRGDEPSGHVRHGISFIADDDPDDDSRSTDRIATMNDLHVMNMPGASIYVYRNGQVRGSNIKCTGSKWGFYFQGVKDGKLAQIGLGKNVSGNVLQDCASLKIKDIDAWTGPESDGSPVLSLISCAKCQIEGGEIEGMVLVQGDNADDGSKSYREEMTNVFPDINFKISEDFYAAAGAGNMATGEGYVALVKVLDGNGVGLARTTGKYKKGIPESKIGNADYRGRYMEWTPNCYVWFGTSIASSDPQYEDWLEACGDADMTGASFIWHHGKATPGRRSIPILPFKEHISNFPAKLKGLTLGRITQRPTGTQQQNEIALDGAEYTSDYYPLLYLLMDPAWGDLVTGPTYSLLDRDPSGDGADPETGYVTFNVWDFSAKDAADSLTLGFDVTSYIVFEQ